MRKPILSILKAVEAKDTEGVVRKKLVPAGQVRAVIIPYSSERAQKDFGITQKVSYRLFDKTGNQEVKENNVIEHDGKKLVIVYVASYGKVRDVLLDTRGW